MKTYIAVSLLAVAVLGCPASQPSSDGLRLEPLASADAGREDHVRWDENPAPPAPPKPRSRLADIGSSAPRLNFPALDLVAQLSAKPGLVHDVAVGSQTALVTYSEPLIALADRFTTDEEGATFNAVRMALVRLQPPAVLRQGPLVTDLNVHPGCSGSSCAPVPPFVDAQGRLTQPGGDEGGAVLYDDAVEEFLVVVARHFPIEPGWTSYGELRLLVVNATSGQVSSNVLVAGGAPATVCTAALAAQGLCSTSCTAAMAAKGLCQAGQVFAAYNAGAPFDAFARYDVALAMTGSRDGTDQYDRLYYLVTWNKKENNLNGAGAALQGQVLSRDVYAGGSPTNFQLRGGPQLLDSDAKWHSSSGPGAGMSGYLGLPAPQPRANLLTNGGFAQGLTGWTTWRQRGNPTVSASGGQASLRGANFNAGIYQRIPTGGPGTSITLTGQWTANPVVGEAQWAEVLVINGNRIPQDGQDVDASQADVVLAYKNDTWASPWGWAGALGPTSPLAARSTFIARGDWATVVLKAGSVTSSTTGAQFGPVAAWGPASSVDAGMPTDAGHLPEPHFEVVFTSHRPGSSRPAVAARRVKMMGGQPVVAAAQFVGARPGASHSPSIDYHRGLARYAVSYVNEWKAVTAQVDAYSGESSFNEASVPTDGGWQHEPQVAAVAQSSRVLVSAADDQDGQFFNCRNNASSWTQGAQGFSSAQLAAAGNARFRTRIASSSLTEQSLVGFSQLTAGCTRPATTPQGSVSLKVAAQRTAAPACQDLTEDPLRWSAVGARLSFETSAAGMGTRYVRARSLSGPWDYRLVYDFDGLVDAQGFGGVGFLLRTPSSGTPPELRGVRVRDAHGNVRLYSRTQALGSAWAYLALNFDGTGWTVTGPAIDWASVAAVEFLVHVYAAAEVDLDGLMLGDGSAGAACPLLACPLGCGGHGSCDAATTTCTCDLGYAAPTCSPCAPGFVRQGTGCVLANDGAYDTWPNPVSRANSDPWLAVHHRDLRALAPRVLVLNFANLAEPSYVSGVVTQVVDALREGSRNQGDVLPNQPPQLSYTVARTIDLRDGIGGRPAPDYHYYDEVRDQLVSVPSGRNVVVLQQWRGETPHHPAAVSTGAWGAVMARLPGASGTHSLAQVAGASGLDPRNRVTIRDPNGQAILSGGQEVFGLLQAEPGVVDEEWYDDGSRQVQLSFVVSSGGQLVAAPTAAMAGRSFRYAFRIREFENSRLYPDRSGWPGFDYAALFGASFAQLYGYAAPGGGFKSLCQLVDEGEVNEVWFLAAQIDRRGQIPAEVLEFKQGYTVRGNQVPGSFDRCAGNGCFWFANPCGRSLRVGFINWRDQDGTSFVHSLGHGIEGSGHSWALPALQEWFLPLNGFDLNRRYPAYPYDSLYALSGDHSQGFVVYPARDHAVIHRGAQSYDVPSYAAGCGNVHFPPNAGGHYDYHHQDPTSPYPPEPSYGVMSFCRSFGRTGAPQEVDEQAWMTPLSLPPTDGSMGQAAFLRWWRQNQPAFGSGQIFSDGRPMLGLWPFLFY